MVKTIYLKAPRERVWAYLTDADKLARWFHEADTALEVGQDYALMSDNTPGQKMVLSCVDGPGCARVKSR
jgi:uncharacterized protein YndB with AHSA1/START domain